MKPSEFWKDPEAYSDEVNPDFIRICLPNEYFRHDHVSERILRAFYAHVARDASILELGCAVGRNLRYLMGASYGNLTGVEINPVSADHARQGTLGVQDGENWVQIINTSIEDYYRKEGYPPILDVVFTQSVFMHLPPESEWVFERIAEHARMIVTHEVEKTGGFGAELKWSRNYQEVFEPFGFKQIEMTDYSPQTLRVLRKGERHEHRNMQG